MGAYINIGNAGFQRVRNSEYVDKSGLIAIVNGTLFTERSLSCVSRSRRFGKSVAAKMLCAYYDQSCDSRHLFADLGIADSNSRTIFIRTFRDGLCSKNALSVNPSTYSITMQGPATGSVSLLNVRAILGWSICTPNSNSLANSLA